MVLCDGLVGGNDHVNLHERAISQDYDTQSSNLQCSRVYLCFSIIFFNAQIFGGAL